MGGTLSVSQWLQLCRDPFFKTPGVGPSGSSWLLADPAATLFFVAAPPNPPVTDCATNVAGVHSAGSLHPGGVNVSMGDGSVRFVRQSIDVGALVRWAPALGAR